MPVDPHSATTTLCIAVAAGAVLMALADRLRVPAIALLLIGGVLLGPEASGLVNPADIGRGLELVVSLAVAVILFEGGLTLDISGFRREHIVISRMLSVGVLVTWIGASAAAHLLFDLPLSLAALAGSLVIVTGPTVVSPILRRIDLRPRLYQILYWEGVLIDAVGVFVAVLCFEWLLASGEKEMASTVARFALRFVAGAGIGVLVGGLVSLSIHQSWISRHHINSIAIGGALVAFGAANSLLSEAGILAVISAGFTLRLAKTPGLEALKNFKLQLTDMAIGLLFVLLSARLRLDLMWELGLPLVFFVLAVLALRPLVVALSTRGQGFSLRERTFLSWLAPRGIVAASMASLFSLRLTALGYEEAAILESLTFSIVASTVLFQGLSAPALASALGLRRRHSGIWLLAGNPELTMVLHEKMRQMGIHSIMVAAPSERPEQIPEDGVSWAPQAVAAQSKEIAAVLAMSPSAEVNDDICERWAPVVGGGNVFRWDQGDEKEHDFGIPACRECPGPRTTLAGIQNDQLVLGCIEVDKRSGSELHLLGLPPLFYLQDEEAHIAGRAEEAGQGRAEMAIIIRDRIPGLRGLVKDALLSSSTSGSDHLVATDVWQQLLALAARDLPDLDIDKSIAELIEREESMPSFIGGGVSVPHLYVEGLEETRCFVALVPVDGRGDDGPDGVPVSLTFLLLSSSNNAAAHLEALGAIARLCRLPGFVERASRTRTPQALLELIHQYSDAY